MTRLIEGNSRAFPGNRKEKQKLKETQTPLHGRENHLRWFCLTDGEGGEEVGAERVRVEGEAVID